MTWPFRLDDVSKTVPPNVARDVRRGRSIYDALEHAARSMPGVLRAAGRAADAALRPAPDAVARPIFGALRGVKDFAGRHPTVARGTVGLALLAPILGSSFSASQHHNEDQLMHLRQDPGRDVTAAEKTASGPAGLMTLPAMGGSIQSSIASGIGSGIGQGIVNGVGSMLSGGLGTLRDVFLTDRKRKQLFSTLLQTDVILHDALERNPAAADMLKEAYGTMCRFAPSLALDINAVRSFLREVVVGGSGVNYVTIKNLIETEKALHSGKHASEVDMHEVAKHIPPEIPEAVRRFGFAKLAARVYGVEEINERSIGTILGEKLATRLQERRTLAAGLEALDSVTRK